MNSEWYYVRGEYSYHLCWLILVFDKNSKTPFSLKRRWYVLNWTRLTQEEASYVAQKYGFDRDLSTEDLPDTSIPAFDNAIETVEYPGKNDSDMLQFRHCFDPISDEDYLALNKSSPTICAGAATVGLVEYFEDLSENPISKAGMLRQIHGSSAIFLGDVESVLALGTSPLDKSCKVSIDDANVFAHYLSVVNQIRSSRWAASNLHFSVQGVDHDIVNFRFPHIHDTRSILILFRQLYRNAGDDNLFVRAANLYIRLIQDARKKAWIKYEKNGFSSALKGKPPLLQEATETNRDFLESFGYGYRIFHAFPKKNAESRLKDMIEIHGPEKVLFAFDHALRQLWVHVQKLALPLGEDVRWWISRGWSPKPQMLDLQDWIGR